MGQAKNVVRDRIKADPERFHREGIEVSDEEFEALEADIDGRHTSCSGSWLTTPPEATLYSCALLDRNGEQRIWPKAGKTVKCRKCETEVRGTIEGEPIMVDECPLCWGNAGQL